MEVLGGVKEVDRLGPTGTSVSRKSQLSATASAILTTLSSTTLQHRHHLGHHLALQRGLLCLGHGRDEPQQSCRPFVAERQCSTRSRDSRRGLGVRPCARAAARFFRRGPLHRGQNAIDAHPRDRDCIVRNGELLPQAGPNEPRSASQTSRGPSAAGPSSTSTAASSRTRARALRGSHLRDDPRTLLRRLRRPEPRNDA